MSFIFYFLKTFKKILQIENSFNKIHKTENQFKIYYYVIILKPLDILMSMNLDSDTSYIKFSNQFFILCLIFKGKGKEKSIEIQNCKS